MVSPPAPACGPRPARDRSTRRSPVRRAPIPLRTAAPGALHTRSARRTLRPLRPGTPAQGRPGGRHPRPHGPVLRRLRGRRTRRLARTVWAGRAPATGGGSRPAWERERPLLPSRSPPASRLRPHWSHGASVKLWARCSSRDRRAKTPRRLLIGEIRIVSPTDIRPTNRVPAEVRIPDELVGDTGEPPTADVFGRFGLKGASGGSPSRASAAHEAPPPAPGRPPPAAVPYSTSTRAVVSLGTPDELWWLLAGRRRR